MTSFADEIFNGLIEIILRNFSSVFEIFISPSVLIPLDSLPFIVDKIFNCVTYAILGSIEPIGVESKLDSVIIASLISVFFPVGLISILSQKTVLQVTSPSILIDFEEFNSVPFKDNVFMAFFF